MKQHIMCQEGIKKIQMSDTVMKLWFRRNNSKKIHLEFPSQTECLFSCFESALVTSNSSQAAAANFTSCVIASITRSLSNIILCILCSTVLTLGFPLFEPSSLNTFYFIQS
jgi:hypothetical protein